MDANVRIPWSFNKNVGVRSCWRKGAWQRRLLVLMPSGRLRSLPLGPRSLTRLTGGS